MMPQTNAVTVLVLRFQKLSEGERLSDVVYVVAALFLWSMLLDTLLRYGLSLLHLQALIYLPKLLLLPAVVLLPLLRPRASLSALVVAALVALFLVWVTMDLPSPVQAAFGLWVLVPLLFGLWTGGVMRPEQWRGLFMAALGVLLDPLIHYPWSGETLVMPGKHIEVSRQWAAFAVERYAGFACVSLSPATQLLVFGLMPVVLLKDIKAKLLVWLVAGAGIALRTSKGPLFCYADSDQGSKWYWK